jgi:hypothetical protein
MASEHDEQVAVFKWAKDAEIIREELELLHAVCNGAALLRGARTGKYLKDEGRKSGVPDICLPARSHIDYAPGLYIEMKTPKGRGPSPEQRWWIKRLKAQGYRVEVCRGAAEAIKVISDYLGIK